MNPAENETVEIHTGLKAGDDSQIGSGNAVGGGTLGSGSATGLMGSGG
jgi:hypothetical protein